MCSSIKDKFAAFIGCKIQKSVRLHGICLLPPPRVCLLDPHYTLARSALAIGPNTKLILKTPVFVSIFTTGCWECCECSVFQPNAPNIEMLILSKLTYIIIKFCTVTTNTHCGWSKYVYKRLCYSRGTARRACL